MNRKNLHRSAVEQEQDGPIRFRLEIGVSASTGARQKDPKATHMRRAEPHRAKIKVGWGPSPAPPALQKACSAQRSQ